MAKKTVEIEGNGTTNRVATAWESVDEAPFTLSVEITGTAPILFHRYDPDSVERKGNAKKGDKLKKTDDIQSYVYRDENGYLGVDASVIHGTLVNAAKRFKDPSNNRASCMEITKAGLIISPATPLFDPKTREWEMEDRRGVSVQRNRVTRVRPAMRAGWRLRFEVTSILPTLLTEERIQELLTTAGTLVGLCDYRPVFGRFRVTKVERLKTANL